MLRNLSRQGSFLNPFIQALPFAVLVILFMPNLFPRYKVEIVQGFNSPDKFIQKYIEVDGNGYNEKVVLYNSNDFIPPLPHVSVYSNNDIPIFDIVLKHSWIEINNLFSADLDKNGKNEMFIFTQSGDTVFLNLYEYHSNDSIRTQTVQVETINSFNGNYDIVLNDIGSTDVNGDGNDDFVFMIASGFHKESRGVFAWDLATNTIIRSPQVGVSFDSEMFYLCNIDQDENKEILLSTYANTIFGGHDELDGDLPYKDTVSYVMALDHDLSLLFDPIPIQCQFLYVLPLQTEDGVKIAALIGFENEEKIDQMIKLYNMDGSLYKSKVLDSKLGWGTDWIFTKNNEVDQEFFLVHTKGGMVECYNSELELTDRWKIEPTDGYPIKPFDLDNDGNNEFIFKKVAHSIYVNDFLITQKDFSDPTSIKFEGRLNGAAMTHKYKTNSKGVFLLQLSNNDYYLCKYYNNPNHNFKFLIWVLIYAILIVFIALVQWAQRIKTQNNINKEKELAKFQIKAIKNQIDPHFTLNTLNTISSLYGKGNNQEAYKYMTKLTRLMLLVLNESDQISSTLKAEVEMIKSYIELQLIRFRDVFTYSIEWDEDRLGEREVPRMLIHTFTENAIKHGLRLKSHGGILKIRISERNKYLFIEIEDNGVGRKAAALDKSLSSGKGVGISNSICDLYYQLRNVKVNYHINDLYAINELTNEEVPVGTKVTITVYPKLFKL